MFDEPSEEPHERSSGPADQAKEKSDEFRMHAELAAVFEACRKFDARLVGLGTTAAREIQQTMGKLEKAKAVEHPILPEAVWPDAAKLLNLFKEKELTTNDYHISRRPGEVMVVRWLEGEEVETFYKRLQAHFDAAMNGYREDQKHSNEWKADAATLEYLAELDKVEVKMAERYLREVIAEHKLFVLSTQTADEINIAYLADHIMSVPVEELVGRQSAPPEEPSEMDLAWFFKLYSLRGMNEGLEQMCFFAFLQKSEESF